MLVRAASVLLLLAALPACGSGARRADPTPVSTSPGTAGAAPWVDPFVGTANSSVAAAVLNGLSGATFPGASLPFGMVQPSPDTPHAAPPGYAWEDDSIVGFSLTHLSGAGCLAMRDFPLFPQIGAVDPSTEPSAHFSHQNEIASPGFYQVRLDSGITVDLTATARSGFYRFTFPRDRDARLLLAGSFQRDKLEVQDFKARVVSPTLVTGQRDDGLFCAANTRYTVYFAARFERPIGATGSWSFGEASDGSIEASGFDAGLYLGFDTRDDPVVQLKLGLSYVSADNALANLDAENPGWDFDAVHRAAIDRWNALLGRIAVEGRDEDKKSFYTALYHVLLSPSLASDASGDYLAFGGARKNAGAHPRYAQISGWDVYRSWAQLAAVLAPVETSDVVRTLVAAAKECGALPKWPIANQESSTMIGDPATPLIVNAWAFGARDFDAKEALAAMVHSASDPKAACDGKIVRDGLADYLARGYCPIDSGEVIWGPVSTTMEYAVADSTIAKFAAALGDAATAKTYAGRAANWKNLFDPARKANGFSGYVQPRRQADDNGAPSFQEVDVTADTGFVEGNAAQYTFMVPHDVPALVALLGGDAAAQARLDAFFTQVNAGTDKPYLYIGNEPGFNAPWIYPFTGAPHRSQKLVRRILGEAFSTAPGGLPGNDDLGATSSWQVWAMLGMYPAIPGVGGVVLGAPTFSKATIALANGKTLVISANAAPDKPYVQSLRVDGKDTTSSWLSWDALANGSKLDFTLAATPNESWGAAPADRPPP